jgi:hypothetical protein
LRPLKVEVQLVTCTGKRQLPPRDYVWTTIAIEVRDFDVVKTLPVNLLHRPTVAAAIPKPNETVVHHANDVVPKVAVNVPDLVVGAEGAFGCNHVLVPGRVLVPHQPTAAVSARNQVWPTVSIDIANSLSPGRNRTALIYNYVVE